MTKEKSSSSKKKKKDGESSKKASNSGKKNTTSSSVKTKSSSKKGSMTKASRQATNCKPPKSKVTKTAKKKTGNASKKASTNKSTAKNKTKLKAKMVAKPKPIEEEETTESEPSEEVQVTQYKKEDKKTKKPNASTSKAAKNKVQLPQVKPAEGQEADQETEEEPVAVETSAAEPTKTEPSQTEHETCEASGESSSNQTEDSGEEGEPEEGTEAVEEEKLEFTKPTINQIKKDTKEKPLSMSEKITAREFESLNDGITDLKSGVQMLKHSYASIIKSLVAMQNRRSKKKAAKEVQEKVAADGKPINFLTTLSTADPNELKTKSCLEATDKYDIERFLNPITRDETFKALFDEVDELNKQTEKLRTSFFDPRGAFLRDKYDSQDEVKLDRAQFNEYKLWTKKLAAIVDDIARNYNDDLLNMFRLT